MGKVLLGVVMTTGHFHKFHFAIKGHHLDPMGTGILDLRNLLAGVGIDDSAWIHAQRLNQLNLHLEKERLQSAKTKYPEKMTVQCEISATHLACTVKANSQGCQCCNYSPAVIAFNSIKRSNARQGPCPAQVFLKHISQVTNIEGIPVILKWGGRHLAKNISLILKNLQHNICDPPKSGHEHNYRGRNAKQIQTMQEQQSEKSESVWFCRHLGLNRVVCAVASRCRTLTVADDSLIFCSTVSRAEKPSSRNENSNALGLTVFMVTSPLDWSQVNCKSQGWQITFSFKSIKSILLCNHEKENVKKKTWGNGHLGNL